MDQRQQDLFYVGAALFLNLDSCEVDDILAQYELSVQQDTVEACRAAIKGACPKRYEQGKRSPYRQLLFGNSDLQ